jgi:transketolase
LGRERPDLVVLDADLSESTRTHKFAKEFPERFFNVGVAEQNLVGTAAGLALSGLTPYASSFAMFLSGRAWEIVRNSVAYPGLNVKLVASHGGVTVGEDGASHQCIEDFAVMRAIPGMTVICPADFTETKQVIRRIGEFKGPVYVRTGRAAVPVLEHAAGYSFREGRGEVLREGADVTLVACGVLVGEALSAADELAKRNIKATVINMASIKPIDQDLLVTWARKTGALVTAEEHNVLGGLGSAVCEALSEVFPVPVVKIGMQDVFGQTGPADALLDYYGLRAKDLVAAAEKAIALKR